jgi:hypothetical protein
MPLPSFPSKAQHKAPIGRKQPSVISLETRIPYSQSAWKGNSAKYVPQQQRRFWSTTSLLALLFLGTSRDMKGGVQLSE